MNQRTISADLTFSSGSTRVVLDSLTVDALAASDPDRTASGVHLIGCRS